MIFKLKIFIAVLVLASLVGLVGCVSIPTSGPTEPDYRSPTRFISGVSDVGAITVSVDGVNQATALALGNATAYLDLPAGVRHMKVVGDTTTGLNLNNTLNTDTRYSVLVVNGTNTQFHKFINVRDLFTYQTLPDDTARVRFLNAVSDSTYKIWRVFSATDTSYGVNLVGSAKHNGQDSVVAGKSGIGYFKQGVPGTRTYILTRQNGYIANARTSTVTVTFTVAATKRYTVLIYGPRTAPLIKKLDDN